MKLFTLIILLFPILIYGQKSDLFALVSQGGFNHSSGMSISWTLGEFFTETVNYGDKIFTQGFQQPNIEVDKLPSPDGHTIEARLFPNPTQDWIRLQLTEATGRYQVEVIDVTGRIFSDSWYEKTEILIDVRGLPTGQYFIHVIKPSDQKRSTYSIVKF